MHVDTATQATTPDLRPTSADDPFGHIVLERMPGLAAPFALVGAASALFSILGLGAFFTGIRSASPLIATVFAAFAGAAAGTLLRRWRSLHAPFRSYDSVILRVVVVVVLTGAAIGFVLEASIWGLEALVAPSVIGGAICSLAFVPSSLVVLAASKRAARARLGSIVAEVDRRTILVSLLAVVAMASGVQAPALALHEYSLGVHPVLQTGVSFAVAATCAAAIAWFWLRDREARARFDEIVRDVPSLDAAEANEPESGAAVDLGLGAERWARAVEAVTYRAGCRPEVVLRGSVKEACAAVDTALVQVRRAFVFSVAMAVLTLGAATYGALTNGLSLLP